MQLIHLKMDNNVADNDYMNLIAFGDEPTFVEEFGTFTANLVVRLFSFSRVL